MNAEKLTKIQQAFKHLSSGNLDFRIDCSGQDEFIEVYQDFNNMADKLQRSIEAGQRLNKELARSNEELDTFAYIAAHDLNSPLATIVSNCKLLELKTKNILSDEHSKHLTKITKHAERMSSLIRALLEYARISQSKKVSKMQDTNQLLSDLLERIQTEIEENKARVSVDSLPAVHADADRIQQLFQNLITNAIKHSGRDTPVIEITGIEQQDSVEFQVKDNGRGIPLEQLETIFTPFRSSNEDSTGIGLATCKKIAEQHEGKIWAESSGKGSTFFVNLPK